MKASSIVARAAAGLLLLSAGGCDRATTGGAPKLDGAAFRGEAALAEVSNFVALGPRDAGTPGAAAAAEYLRGRLTALGIAAHIDPFADATPDGMRKFFNVVGRILGPGKGLVVLGSHFDTKSGLGADFVGANDGGSSTGLLLALGEFLNQRRAALPCDVVLAFFDGEECRQSYSKTDGLHGSRHYARVLRLEAARNPVRGVIVLDMVGDADLRVGIPRNSTAALVSLALDAAHAQGVRTSFELNRSAVLDDHVPFLEAGFPAIDLIDFDYGSAPGKNDYWHTSADTVDKLSARSLHTMGLVVLEMLNNLP